DIIVGDPAFNVLKNDRIRALKTGKLEGSNAYIEFKRTMGTNTKYPSSNLGKDFTSEELSAEVLMKLKSFITDEVVKSIVITVPAKFTMGQKDATVRAGKLAGFQHIELLQEPIAASMAYGLDATNKDGIWLVFDFGGGTFDAALIKIEDGIMKVIDTEGDNWLGGKNIDEAMVDQILIPYLEDNYAISEILNDSVQREILRSAVKFYAEECKIQMSFKETHNILTDLGDLPFTDENGEEPSLDIIIDQQTIYNVVAPIFQHSIDICKDLLKRNNLKGSQLTTLLLVGGPTYSPILRKMLREQITNEVNTSIDPMTSVATGAALFASTIAISENIIEQGRDKTKIQLEIKHEATTVELDEMINIKILKEKTTGMIPNKTYAEIIRGDKAWSSGKKQVGDKATLIEVQLNAGASNSFDVVLFDEQGDKLECQPNSFNILQGINPGQTILPYHIGIEINDRILSEDVFIPIKGLEKNQKVPATGVITGLKTQKAIKPGMQIDKIVIPIYQGEDNAEGTRSIYNEHVNDVIITGESLPGLLPEGSEIEITLKVDRSEQMTLSAFFPYLNYTEEIPVKFIQKDQVSEFWLKSEISRAKKLVRKFKSNINSSQLDGISNSLDLLERQLENEKASSDGKFKILENLRRDLRGLDNIAREAEWPEVEKKMKEAY
ncbi:MAG: Hsp70 family protein, partial [Flavobacterium sp.]